MFVWLGAQIFGDVHEAAEWFATHWHTIVGEPAPVPDAAAKAAAAVEALETSCTDKDTVCPDYEGRTRPTSLSVGRWVNSEHGVQPFGLAVSGGRHADSHTPDAWSFRTLWLCAHNDA